MTILLMSSCVLNSNCLVLCLWAGLFNFGSAACRHYFNCCRLYICVSPPVWYSVSTLNVYDGCWGAVSWFLLSVLSQRPSETVCHQIPWNLLGIFVSYLLGTKHTKINKYTPESTILKVLLLTYCKYSSVMKCQNYLSVHRVVYFVVYCILICCKESR